MNIKKIVIILAIIQVSGTLSASNQSINSEIELINNDNALRKLCELIYQERPYNEIENILKKSPKLNLNQMFPFDNRKNSPLTFALRNYENSAPILELLIKHGADVRGNKDISPLITAVRCDDENAVATLLAAGADKNKTDMAKALIGSLVYPCDYNITKMLLERGVNLTLSVTKATVTPLDALTRNAKGGTQFKKTMIKNISKNFGKKERIKLITTLLYKEFEEKIQDLDFTKSLPFTNIVRFLEKELSPKRPCPPQIRPQNKLYQVYKNDSNKLALITIANSCMKKYFTLTPSRIK